MFYRVSKIFIISLCFFIVLSLSANADSAKTQNRSFGPSCDGIRAVWDFDTMKAGYVDEEGNIVVPIEHAATMDFVNGIGLLLDEDVNGRKIARAINTKGEVVLDFDPELGEPTYFDGEYGIIAKYFDAGTSGRFALIDGQGRLRTGYDYYTLSAKGENGPRDVLFAEIMKDGNLRRGILNGDGNVVIPLEYSYIANSEKWDQDILSVQKKNGSTESDFVWGYMHKDGVPMAPCIYESAEVFCEGYGRVLNKGKWAVINTYGQFVTGFDFDGLNIFNEGLAVATKAGKSGVIDTTGKEVVPCIYDYISEFQDGYAVADLSGTGEQILLESPIKKSRDISIYLSEKWVYTDQPPIIESGRTLVPLRSVVDTLEYTVDWNEETKQITLQNQKYIIHLQIGRLDAIVNQLDDGYPPETVLLDVSPKIVNGRALVPLRFIAESTGAQIEWNNIERTIKISI